jgi:glucosamine--fructose-6-phosphate aminotransferase (isomerizing)
VQLPLVLEKTLKLAPQIEEISRRFYTRSDFLYLGRGINYPIALIDENMPVVAIAPTDHVLEKMIGNILEVKARGGSVAALVTDGDRHIEELLDPATDFVLRLPPLHRLLTPVAFVLPLQLLAYYVAVRRGCDVDQPRNLAKSVTVE